MNSKLSTNQTNLSLRMMNQLQIKLILQLNHSQNKFLKCNHGNFRMKSQKSKKIVLTFHCICQNRKKTRSLRKRLIQQRHLGNLKLIIMRFIKENQSNLREIYNRKLSRRRKCNQFAFKKVTQFLEMIIFISRVVKPNPVSGAYSLKNQRNSQNLQ